MRGGMPTRSNALCTITGRKETTALDSDFRLRDCLCTALSSQQNQRADFHRTYRSEHAGQPIEAKNRLAKEQLKGLQVLGGHLERMRSAVAVEKSDRPNADADGGEDG